MAKNAGEFTINCESTTNGTVKLSFNRAGEMQEAVDLPVAVIGPLVTALLGAGAKASDFAGKQEGAARDMPVITPTAIGLSGSKTAPLSLVVHSGQIQFGITLPPAEALRELGEKLIAVSASKARSN